MVDGWAEANMSAKRYEGKIAGSYDLEQTIGRGHFAVVKLARHVYSGEKVAVKVIDKTKLDDVSKAHLFQEVGCMKLVQHPNVVRLYEVIDTPSKLYLIMELGDGGDMYDFISRHERGLAEETARRYFRQIVHAINYCHRLHVVHRDLKLENVVIFEKLGIVKLTDFGFSNKFVPGRKLETSCGSLAYSAPEILLGDSYDAPAVDVWSLGVILYMLVCGELPFQEANDSETLTMIMDCKYTVPSHVSPECQDLLSKMLVRDPKKRATLQEILNHRWLTRGDPAPLPLLPLISWEHLTPEEHSLIISKMVARKMASKEEILKALEQNAYNHITATYYLLAESRLRKQREKQAHIAMVTKTAAGPRQQQPPQPNPKTKLAPLALSPRVKSADSSRSDVSTSPTLAPKQRPGTPVEPSYHLHKCSIIEEEVLEEGDEEGSQNECGDDIRHQNYMEECLSDDSDTRGSEESSASRSGMVSAPKRAMPVRPLHSVRSSPQLLNQIFEEGEEGEEEEEEEEDLMPPVLSTQTLTRSKHQSSPEVVHKYEMRRRRAARIQRGASHSSSDTSDTDDTESRRRRQHRQQAATGDLYRRDSSDHSSDTDGGQSGFSAGTGPLFTSHTPSMTSRASRNKSTTTEQKTTSSQKSNTSKSTSSKHMSSKQNGISPTSSLLGKRDSSGDRDNSHSELGRKVSNVSTTSNMSNLSLTSTNSSRSNRYVVDTPAASSSQQPPPSMSSAATVPSSKDLEAALNEENKAKSRIIHVRSKDFSDLMERFSAGKHKEANPVPQASTASSVFPPLQKAHDATGIKFRKRPKERMKTDINKNGLIAHADCSMEEEQANTAQTPQQQNIVKTKCCSVV